MDVAVAFSEEEHKLILFDYKLSKHPNNLSINITEQELDDYTEEEQEKLITVPFHIIIDVHAEYINRSDDEEPVKIKNHLKLVNA